MKIIEISIPEEIIDLLGSEDAARKGAHEAFVFDLVRRGTISKGKAAELLGISLWELPELIAQYQIPWFTTVQRIWKKIWRPCASSNAAGGAPLEGGV
jgi:predicted HTH domain antitoxin